MRRLKLKAKILLLSFAAFVSFIMPVSTSADQLPEGVKQVWTAVEGNLIYYVKPGDKVKKGEPLFLVITPDNNPEVFFQILHKIYYYNRLYLRRESLIKNHAISQDEFDNALNDLISTEDDLASYICKLKEGFYVAPFDCEVVELLYLNESGIGDGNPAINIKSTDVNYKFEPKKPNKKLVEIMALSDELLKNQVENLDVNKVISYLNNQD